MKRDRLGRFESVKNDALDLINLCYLLFRLIPIFVILYILFSYYEVNTVLVKIVLKLVCGKDCVCQCSVESKNNGGWGS